MSSICSIFPAARRSRSERCDRPVTSTELRDRAHRAGVPVIYVNDNWGRWRSDFKAIVADCSKADRPGAPIAELLKPTLKDFFVLKPHLSGFHETPLDTLLQTGEVETLIITGFAADNCVLFTAAEAHMRDYTHCRALRLLCVRARSGAASRALENEKVSRRKHLRIASDPVETMTDRESRHRGPAARPLPKSTTLGTLLGLQERLAIDSASSRVSFGFERKGDSENPRRGTGVDAHRAGIPRYRRVADGSSASSRKAGRRRRLKRAEALRRNFLSAAMVQKVLSEPKRGAVTTEDYGGDFQMHSRGSDGADTIETLAKGCIKRGYRCMCVTDHSYGLPIAGGMTMKEIRAQHAEINAHQQEVRRRVQSVQRDRGEHPAGWIARHASCRAAGVRSRRRLSALEPAQEHRPDRTDAQRRCRYLAFTSSAIRAGGCSTRVQGSSPTGRLCSNALQRRASRSKSTATCRVRILTFVWQLRRKRPDVSSLWTAMHTPQISCGWPTMRSRTRDSQGYRRDRIVNCWPTDKILRVGENFSPLEGV